MRLILNLSGSKELIPFNYQHYLTGAIHKWIGENNNIHGKLSLFSFSWIQNVDIDRGLKLRNDSCFFISAYDETFLKNILKNILIDPSVFFNINVSDVQILPDPVFESQQKFMAASPIFIKRGFENKIRHVLYDDPESSQFMTETLKKKLLTVGLNEDGVNVKFDTSFNSPKVKLIKYKEIENKVNLCPVIIVGSTEQIAFAWNVGIGNSTGIGFGALK